MEVNCFIGKMWISIAFEPFGIVLKMHDDGAGFVQYLLHYESCTQGKIESIQGDLLAMPMLHVATATLENQHDESSVRTVIRIVNESDNETDNEIIMTFMNQSDCAWCYNGISIKDWTASCQ